MLVRLNVGAITDPKQELVDDNLTLQEVITTFGLNGEVSLNGASLNTVARTTTLKELGVTTGDYLCTARKNGGN